MILDCKKCNYSWDYNGKSKYYATCPRCRNTNIKIIKHQIKKEIKENNDPDWVKEDLSNSGESDEQ